MAICRIPECETIILPGRLMCGPHWDVVPWKLRCEIFEARRLDRYRRRRKPLRRLMDANARAVENVCFRLGLDPAAARRIA